VYSPPLPSAYLPNKSNPSQNSERSVPFVGNGFSFAIIFFNSNSLVLSTNVFVFFLFKTGSEVSTTKSLSLVCNICPTSSKLSSIPSSNSAVDIKSCFGK
jgi:hypothetical protein